ncbi:MAG: RAD55 family ATPase [Haloglomus sp.]
MSGQRSAERSTDESDDESDPYRFDGLPLAPIPAGRNILVCGPPHVGTRRLVLQMVTGSLASDEAAVLVTTDADSDDILEDCRERGANPWGDAIGVVDCVGGGEKDGTTAARVTSVSGPDDLTGIGMRYSGLCADFDAAGIHRIRMGVVSVSTLLSFGDVRRTSRFIHTLTGRNASIGGLGAFLLDPETQDERTVRTIAHFCDGRIQVRAVEDDRDAPAELRVQGVPGPTDWTPFDMDDV